MGLDGSPPRPFRCLGLEDNALSVSWSSDGRWLGIGGVPGAPGQPVAGDLSAGTDLASFPTKSYIAPADGSTFFINSTLGTAAQWRPSAA